MTDFAKETRRLVGRTAQQEAEIAAARAWPGSLIGYEAIVEDDGGGMRVVGAKQTDECFTHETMGTINISAMWRDIQAAAVDARYLPSVLLNDSALDALHGKDLDVETIAKMTPARANVPVLLVARRDGTHAMIDGNHRFAYRHQHGEKYFTAWEFPESAFSTYRVDLYIRETGKHPWVLQSPRALLARTIGTYAVRDDAGNVVGMRDERKKA